ncbi:hypothetical protein GBA52_001017 [Prunus armeniaca]|nr:hypothetical protein GBA52_001017 [Prunus armeniaca]
MAGSGCTQTCLIYLLFFSSSPFSFINPHFLFFLHFHMFSDCKITISIMPPEIVPLIMCLPMQVRKNVNQFEKMEDGLARARAAIREAARSRSYTSYKKEAFCSQRIGLHQPLFLSSVKIFLSYTSLWLDLVVVFFRPFVGQIHPE